MPIQIEELLQLLLFDETPITLLRPGEILVWQDCLIHVSRLKVVRGEWFITGSWGEQISGRVRTGAGITRVLRIPIDWLARTEVPIVRRAPPDSPEAATPEPERPVDAELIKDIFRGF